MACFVCSGPFAKQARGYQRKSLIAPIIGQQSVGRALESLCNEKIDFSETDFVCLPCFRAVSRAISRDIEARQAEKDVLKRLGKDSPLKKRKCCTPRSACKKKQRFFSPKEAVKKHQIKTPTKRKSTPMVNVPSVFVL